MQHSIPTLLIVASALTAAPALGAQSMPATRPVSFGLAGALNVPSGNLADFTGNGYSVKALLQSARGPLGWRGELSYGSLEGDDVGAGAATITMPDTRILSATLNVLFGAGAPMGRTVIQPYAIAGGGVYNFDYGDMDDPDLVDEFASATDFGLNAGLGLRFPLGPMGAFAEARFHNVFSAGEATRYFSPLTVGITF